MRGSRFAVPVDAEELPPAEGRGPEPEPPRSNGQAGQAWAPARERRTHRRSSPSPGVTDHHFRLVEKAAPTRTHPRRTRPADEQLPPLLALGSTRAMRRAEVAPAV